MDADSTQDANAALELLKQNNYDLVLLDINMPGLTGFELCEKLRALPQHAKTPVIFVTAFNNFENRKQSVLSGGGDLIAKPVAPLELALKVTIHLLKAPPKPVLAPAPTPAGLVWKEPAEIISHDTEMFLKGVEKLNLPTSIPTLIPSTTETLTTDAEKEVVEAAAPAPALEPAVMAREVAPAAPAMAPAREVTPAPAAALVREVNPEPVPMLKMASAPEAKPEIKPEVKPAPVVAPAPVSTPAPTEILQPAVAAAAAPAAPVSKEEPVSELAAKTVEAATLESVAKSRPLADEGKVVKTPRSSEPAVPASNGNSKEKKPMSQETNQQFEPLVLDVAHIIFGENAPEINVRLVRMAMDQVWKNRANLQTLDSIAKEIARIIFGDSNASELNVRLVKMALERSNSIELFKAAA
jgi:CheY-like chemotaxis protein